MTGDHDGAGGRGTERVLNPIDEPRRAAALCTRAVARQEKRIASRQALIARLQTEGRDELAERERHFLTGMYDLLADMRRGKRAAEIALNEHQSDDIIMLG